MALELRPNCEYCDKDLRPDATEARICAYECTFCGDCVRTALEERLPQLRQRFRAPADQTREGVAPWTVAGQAAGLDEASDALLQLRGNRPIRSRGHGRSARTPLI